MLKITGPSDPVNRAPSVTQRVDLGDTILYHACLDGRTVTITLPRDIDFGGLADVALGICVRGAAPAERPTLTLVRGGLRGRA